MQNVSKKVVSVTLSAVLATGFVPASAFAELSDNALLEQADQTATITWGIKDATLTLEGTGAMPDYSEEEPAPWGNDAQASTVTTVKVEDGITTFDRQALVGLDNVERVVLAASVTSVDSDAFADLGENTTVEVNDPAFFSELKAMEGAYDPDNTSIVLALSEDYVDIEGDLAYNGKDFGTVSVSIDGTALVADADYTLELADDAEASTVTATVTGKGAYTGAIEKTFNVAKTDIADAVVAEVEDVVETGAPIEPAFDIAYDENALTLGTDYEVVYAGDHTEPGVVEAVINGIGWFSGSTTATFNILKKGTEDVKAKLEIDSWEEGQDASAVKATTESGDYAAPVIEYRAKGADDEAWTETMPSEVGNYEARATWAPTEVYPEATATTEFSIRYASSKFAIDYGENSIVYNGAEQTPEPTVTFGDTVLVAGSNYTVEYADNTNAGTAKATILGAGDYEGLIEVDSTFVIEKADATLTSDTLAATLQVGKDSKTVTLKAEGVASVEASSNSANVEVEQSEEEAANTITLKPVSEGMATITIKSKPLANYNAAADVTIKVEVLAADVIVLDYQDTATFSAALAGLYDNTGDYDAHWVVSDAGKDVITVESSETKIGYFAIEGDKIEAYGNTEAHLQATAAGYAEVTATFCGKTVSLQKVHVNKAVIEEPTVSSFAYDGTVHSGIAESDGYTLSGVAMATSAGTYTTKVTPDANHMWADGTQTTREYTWSISPVTFDNVTISVDNQKYTGLPLEPEIKFTGLDFTPTRDVDYKATFTDNTNAGTAKVEIEGIGSCSGKLECTFMILCVEHTWNAGEVTTQPTCTEKGVTTYTCTVCGETKTEDIAALGHKLVEVEAKPATATETGNNQYWLCSECGKAFKDAEGTQETTVEDETIPVIQGGEIERLAGDDAYGTMQAVVDEGFDSCNTVILATFSGYWDALSASGLAGVYNCPVLLTDTNSLSSAAASELERLGAKNVIIVGGTSAVSASVKSSLDNLGYKTYRVAGANAAGTSYEIYKAGKAKNAWGNTCIIATSGGYWDALAASPLSYADNAPIFLTNGSGSLDANALTAITSGEFTNIIICGGTSAVSSSVESAVKGYGRTVVRLGGANAYGTAASIAQYCIDEAGMTAANVACATGGDFYDALTGAALCGKNKSPLVLVDEGQDAGFDFVEKNASSVAKAYIFGGEAAVSEACYERLEAILKSE